MSALRPWKLQPPPRSRFGSTLILNPGGGALIHKLVSSRTKFQVKPHNRSIGESHA